MNMTLPAMRKDCSCSNSALLTCSAVDCRYLRVRRLLQPPGTEQPAHTSKHIANAHGHVEADAMLLQSGKAAAAHRFRKPREAAVAARLGGRNMASSFGHLFRRPWQHRPPPQTVPVTTRDLLCRQRTPAATSSSRKHSIDFSVSLQQQDQPMSALAQRLQRPRALECVLSTLHAWLPCT